MIHAQVATQYLQINVQLLHVHHILIVQHVQQLNVSLVIVVILYLVVYVILFVEMVVLLLVRAVMMVILLVEMDVVVNV